MDRRRTPRDLAVKATKAIAESMGTPAGRIAAAGAAVLVLVGVVTAMVTSKPNPQLVVALILLGLVSAVLAAMQQRSAQPQPAALGSMVLYDFSAVGPYGDARFWARHNYRLSEIPYAASGQSSTSGTEPGLLVDRAGECEVLGRALRDDGPAVIVVYGPPGAGKSALVSQVLLEASLSETTVRRYDLPGDRLDAKRLCEDIGPSRLSGTGLRPGEDVDVLTRLEAAVEAPDDAPVPIVVDGAQYLLDPDTYAIISLELAEAIEVIAGGSRRVKLILVFQERPVPKAGSGWLASAVDMPVGGLAREDFEICLRQLDPGGEFGLVSRS